MMQSAQHWCGDNGSASVDGASQRCVLAQPQVCARLIVVERIRGQDPSQMPLAEDQDVIQALAAECSDQAFNRDSARATAVRSDDPESPSPAPAW